MIEGRRDSHFLKRERDGMCFRIRRNRDAINVGVCQAHSVHDNLAFFEDGVEFRLERGRLAVGIIVVSVGAGCP